MPKIRYIDKAFNQGSLEIIDYANEIIEEYIEKGFDLTLRQIYHQFVARNMILNNERSYKRLGSIINDARLAGLIDWEAIVDRTRYLRKLPTWRSHREIMRASAEQYRVDKWKDQGHRPEVGSRKTPCLVL